MNEIRKEYKEFKLINEDIRQDAKKYILSNVILLNEKFDRTNLHRLNSSIQRFDQKFGPYRTKLPAIAKVLQDAEKGLYIVITGGAGKKSAGHMLERMTMIYNIMSNFFGRDLNALLKTPVFRTAVAMPEKALNQIEHPDHNPKMIKKVFIAALKPDRVEREVFDRIYKSIPMPSINWNECSKQLMNLSVNDLNELCGIENVPAVVVNSSEANVEAGANSEEQGVLQEQTRTIEERPEFQAIQRAVTQLLQIARENRLTNFETAIKNLSDDLIELVRDQSLGTRAATFFSSLGGLLRQNDPAARLTAQAVRAVQTFSVVRRTWNQNKEFFLSRVSLNNNRLSDEDKDAIKQLLTRALERGGQLPGALASINPFRIESYPGLSPEEIVDAYLGVIENDIRTSGVYTITYDDNNADGGSLAKTEDTFRRGGPGITLPDGGSLTKAGYNFSGWSTSRTGSRVSTPYTPTANVTLYARWTRSTSGATPSGGSSNPAPSTGGGGGAPPIPSPRPRPTTP